MLNANCILFNPRHWYSPKRPNGKKRTRKEELDFTIKTKCKSIINPIRAVPFPPF